MSVITTPITQAFKIKHPILLAGMNVAAGPELAAAVTNAGGLGVIGGVGYTPKMLRMQIAVLKENLVDKNGPFGIDLLIPQVGGNARKTNYDYTKGQLSTLIDVIIEEKASLFVCAIGVPPREVVDRLHRAGIFVMNMVGHPKHVPKALEAGVDIICAQGSEGGGHTGEVPSSVLIPACVDAVKSHRSPLTGQPIYIVGAGGVYDGRSLAANLAWGAQAVWVGTRFVATREAGAPKAHKETLLQCGFEDAKRTTIFTGRPLRGFWTPYVYDWEDNRREEQADLLAKGIIPHDQEMQKHPEKNIGHYWLMGSVAALIHDIVPAKQVIDDMVRDASDVMRRNAACVNNVARL